MANNKPRELKFKHIKSVLPFGTFVIFIQQDENGEITKSSKPAIFGEEGIDYISYNYIELDGRNEDLRVVEIGAIENRAVVILEDPNDFCISEIETLDMVESPVPKVLQLAKKGRVTKSGFIVLDGGKNEG